MDTGTQNDVERALDALRSKQRPYALLWDYYSGQQPLQYTAEQMQKVFRRLKARWTENWCCVVVDSLLDRLNLTGFSAEDETAKTSLEELWNEQDIALDVERAHKSVLVTGESFVIVEQTEDDKTRVFTNPAHLCHAFYREDNPKAVEFACKWWEEGGSTKMTLYYPDRLEHYSAPGVRAEATVSSRFSPDPEMPDEPNPWGVVPVFHIAPDPERIQGELINVLPLQNGINKLFADMMVSAEFGAFKQRFIVSNADTAKLKNGPNELWEIPAGDKETDEPTQVGSFEATELSNFIAAMDNLATKVAVITRTPKHYLLQAGDVSGEALLAMEAPLTKKAAKYAERFTVCWQQVMQFALQLRGITLERQDIDVTWADERTVQPLMEAQARKTNVDAGIPLITQLRNEGWSEAELEQLEEDRDGEEASRSQMSDVAVAEARRRFDQGEGVAPYSPLAPVPGAPSPSPSAESE